jgi:signal transduction histidine kinase
MDIVGFFQNNIQNILMLVISAISFFVGAFVYRKKKKDVSSKYFALAAVSIGLWVASRAFLQLSDIDGLASFWGYFLFYPTVIIAISLFYFSVYVGNEKRIIGKLAHINILIPWFFLVFITLIPGCFLFYGYNICGVYNSVQETTSGINEVVYGQAFKLFFAPVMFIYLLANFPILCFTYRRAPSELKIKLRYIIIGMLFSILAAIIANILLPVLGKTNFISLGPLAVVVLVVTVGYALLREDLWDLKLVLTEVLTLSILLFLLFDIVLGEYEINILFFKAVSFVLMLFFSWYLIKGIFREFRAKEHMKDLTLQLKIANERLKEIDVEKSEFVSIATHQLRTPLTVIKGYASMILEGSFGALENDKHKEIMQKILSAGERLVAMIEDFLNLSRIESGEMKYHFAKIDLIKLIEDIIEEFKASVEGAQSQIHIHKDDASFFVLADSLKIRQVFNNLIDNAIKYSARGEPIDVTLSRREEHVLVAVHDRGIGIAKEVLPKLFQKFSRVHGIPKLHKEGRGLGLYVAKQIVTAHKGRIWVESPGEGMGSTFFVELPDAEKLETRREVKELVTTIES